MMTAQSLTTTFQSLVAVLLVTLGAMFVAAAHPPLASPATLMIDLVFWPLDGAQTLAAPETRLLLAVGGGIAIGWGVTLILAASALADRPAAFGRILLLSIAAWFVTDTLGSYAAGAYLNMGFNMVFAAVFVWAATAFRRVADA